MSHFLRHLLLVIALGVSCGSFAQAQDDATAPPAATAETDSITEATPRPDSVKPNVPHRNWRGHEHDRDHDDDDDYKSITAAFGRDVHVKAGEIVDGVSSVGGTVIIDGTVRSSVASVFGRTIINGEVGMDAASIMGDLELGPNAHVKGDLKIIGGQLKRAPTARVDGKIEQVTWGALPQMSGLGEWIKHCLMLGRPLALEASLTWAWVVALGFLGFYILLALMFRDGVDRCVQTLRTRPGRSALTAVLSMLLTPVAFLVLLITGVGILLMPFLWLALIVAGFFGKAVILASLGGSITRSFGDGPMRHPALGVLIGGLLVLPIYTVPFLGFIVYKLLGILGFGVVVYTIVLSMRSKKEEGGKVSPPPAAAPAPEVAAATGATTAPSEPFISAEGSTSAAEPQETPQPSSTGSESAASAAAATANASVASGTNAAPLAGFWVRMGALAIDVLLIGLLVTLLNVDGIWLLALAIYGALMWKLRSTTVGGIICGLQVVRYDGRPLDWSTVIVRALSCFISLIVAGLGFIWIAFDDRKQGWHDKIAGTLVVRAPKGASLV